MGRHWNKLEDDILRTSDSTKEAASKLGDRSYSSVGGRRRRLKRSDEFEKEDLLPEAQYFLSRTGKIRKEAFEDLEERAQGRVRKRAPKRKPNKRGSAYGNTKSGWRFDLGINVRSNWEANVLRILDLHDIEWEFEPRVFRYPVKRGNKAYIPDIFLPDTQEWIEVKGYLDDNSRVKIKRFKIHHPEHFERLTMIVGQYNKKTNNFCEELGVPIVLHYQQLGRYYKDHIPEWEGR